MFPSLNAKSLNSSSPFFPAPPLRETTPLSSTFAFFPSETETFEISGKVSVLELLEMDFYKNKNRIKYLQSLVSEVLNSGFHFIIPVEVDWVPDRV